MARHGLSDEEWSLVEACFPRPKATGRPPMPARQAFDGICWILRAGAPWRDLPEEFGAWETVYAHFNRWSSDGAASVQGANTTTAVSWMVLTDGNGCNILLSFVGATAPAVSVHPIAETQNAPTRSAARTRLASLRQRHVVAPCGPDVHLSGAGNLLLRIEEHLLPLRDPA